ncbi:tetratricopeptide repeat protein [bacterium]|nr:tetratricopeptide repeat protein [bacterium]
MVKTQKVYTEYSKYIQYGALAIVVIIVISSLMIKSKKDAEYKASAQLGIVENLVNSNQWDAAVPELNNLLETFPGTQSAGRAVLYLAKAAIASDNAQDAKTHYKKFIDKYDFNSYLTSTAMAGYAVCFEDEKSFDEALRWYKQAFSKDPESFHAPAYLKSAARCAGLAGQNEKARQIYQQMLDDFADSNESRDVEFLLKALN